MKAQTRVDRHEGRQEERRQFDLEINGKMVRGHHEGNK